MWIYLRRFVKYLIKIIKFLIKEKRQRINESYIANVGA